MTYYIFHKYNDADHYVGIEALMGFKIAPLIKLLIWLNACWDAWVLNLVARIEGET